MATPMDEASKRCGSWVEFSATTANTTSPGCRYFSPCERGTSLQLGGKIEETRTRFCAAMPASRRASSKDVSRSRCFPTPLVKKQKNVSRDANICLLLPASRAGSSDQTAKARASRTAIGVQKKGREEPRGCSRRKSDLSGGFLGYQGAGGFSRSRIRDAH